ncbi:MAG: hypothetical protein ACYTGR_09415 [Planctomycetota bacterium]
MNGVARLVAPRARRPGRPPRPVLVVAVALLAGCTPPPRATELAVTPVEARGTIEAAALFDPNPCTWQFVDVDDLGTDLGTAAIVVTRTATERYRAGWETTFGTEHSAYWTLEDGSILTTVIIDHDQRAVSVFEPPLLLMPRTLDAGVEVTARSAMRVLDERNPRRMRESGSATRRIEWIGDAVVPTAGGEVRAHVIRVTFEADLRLAEAIDTTTFYVHPELGTLVRLEDRTITALGIPVTTQRELRLQTVRE